jgi:uncharacterized protein (TIGR00251 family)
MKLYITVITRSRKPGIIQGGKDHYTVRVAAVPEKGKANEELCCRLADHFSIKRSDIHIVRGHTSRKKIVEISDPVIKKDTP